jgi:hypothetical protein
MRPPPLAVAVPILLGIAVGAIWCTKRAQAADAAAAGSPTSPRPVQPATPQIPGPALPVSPATGAPAANAPAELDAFALDLRQVLRRGDPAAIERWLQQRARQDPLRVLELVDPLDREPRNRARSIILAAWMRDAPRLALAWTHAHFPDFFNWPEYAIACAAIRDISLVEEGLLQRRDADPIANKLALRRVTLEWGKVDPGYMMTWVQHLAAANLPAELRNYAMAGVLEARARTEPDEVIRWIRQTAPYDLNSRRHFYHALAQGWIDTGRLDAAEKFFGANLANPDYNLAMNVALPALAAQSPARAEAWLRVLPAPLLYTAMINTAGAVEKKDPGLAARWWLTYNPDLNREPSVRNLERKLATLPPPAREDVSRLIEATPQLTPENRARLLRALAAAK